MRTNSGTEQSTNWYTLTNASHTIEIAWKAASTSTSTNGGLDGTLRQTLSSVANSTYRLEEAWLGPASRTSAGISGTEYFNAFESRRQTYIGLVTAGSQLSNPDILTVAHHQ